MSDGNHAKIYPARGTLTYSDIDDGDAIKTSIATAVTDQTYTGAALNGAMATPGPAFTKMHRLSVTTAANAGTYIVGSEINFTCTDQHGNVRTLTATIGDADGGEVLDAVDEDGNDAGAMTVTTIVADAQNDVNGAFQFGVTDVVFDQPARAIRGGAAGNIMVEFEGDLIEGTMVWADTWAVAFAGETYPATFVKRIMDATTTAFPVTVFL